MNLDAKLIITSNAFRNLGYGILEVMFALFLTEIGFSSLQIGALLTATLFGSALLNLIFVMLADRVGRRRVMIAATLTMIASGLVLIFSQHFLSYLLIALSGTLNFTAISTGGFVGLDQAVLPQLTSVKMRNRVFGIYNSVALLGRMLGALISSVPSALEEIFGLTLLNGYILVLALFVVLGFMSLLCITRLSEVVEVQEEQLRVSRRFFGVGRSRRTILRISALFGIDAFTSGLVATSLIVLLFYYRFDVGTEVMGPVYTGSRLLQIASYQVAVLLADRFGLLNTMVFTHLPSQLLLITLPFAPNLPLAIVILILRQSLAHMDIPTRQAYVATVVDPEDRTTAAGVSNFTRNLAQGISPTFTGYALQTMAYGIPFLLAGLLGIVYDLALYASFRGIKPPHETAGSSPETS